MEQILQSLLRLSDFSVSLFVPKAELLLTVEGHSIPTFGYYRIFFIKEASIHFNKFFSLDKMKRFFYSDSDKIMDFLCITPGIEVYHLNN